jgi:hypothetical protein
VEREDEITEAEFNAALEAWQDENTWADKSYSGSFTVLGEIRKEKFLQSFLFRVAKWVESL